MMSRNYSLTSFFTYKDNFCNFIELKIKIK